MPHLTHAEAMIAGLIQDVTDLFPVSSLGHNVLPPATYLNVLLPATYLVVR